MSWFRRKRFGPPEQARMLHQMLALDDYEPLSPGNFEVPAKSEAVFTARTRLYREALVLLALIEKGTSYAPILKSYENILFGSDPNDIAAYRRMVQTKDAMRELAGIMYTKREYPDVGWARAWIAEAGYDETNPATLSLFFMCWMDLFVAVRESLENMTGKG